MQLITIHNEALTATFSTLGAELQSLRDAQGVVRLWQGDPAWWAGRAPILFPFPGALKDDCYYLNGQKYAMPKHGFARKLEWQLENQTDDAATFLMTQKHEGFPFEYELRAIYQLRGNALEITYRVSNLDSQAFVFSVGAHEGYATPEGIEQYELVFDQEERLAAYPVIGSLIGPEPEVLFESVRALRLKPEYFAKEALVFRDLKSRGVTLRSRLHGREIRVDYPDFGVLLLWTIPGAGLLCIEPWCSAPDLVDSDQNILHKPGCTCLEPGQIAEKKHAITVR